MRQAGLGRFLGAALSAALAVLGVTPLGASAVADDVDTMLWGAYADARMGSMDETSLARMEATAGRRLGVVREFLSWDSPFPTSYHTGLRDNGYPVIFSVKSKRRDGTVVPWADIAAAQPGSALYAEVVGWADRMKAYGVPLRFAFNHEPESKSSSTMGDAASFIAAWRRVHDVFAQRGATNVDFILIMTDYAFMVGPAASNYGPKWYPGDGYLDAIGIDAYNWHTCRSGISNPWKSLEQIIRPFRDFGALHPDEELWLTEYATVEDPAVPGRKKQWFADAQALFQRADYAQFAGVSYFDRKGVDNCVWYVDTSASSIEGFRAMGADVFYGGTGTPPQPDPEPVEVSFVATAGANANKVNHSVQVPATVRAGDTMLLFFTANSNPTTTARPSGWSPVDAVDTGGLRGRVWVRTATGADAGSTVTVANSSITKADLTLSVYRGLDASPVDVHARSVTTTTTDRYWAPSVTPTQEADWVVVYWADKSSTNTGHAIPGELTRRRTASGSGGGHITATVADPARVVEARPTGGFLAVGTQRSSGAVTHTIALRSAPTD
jgi:hypothetical protein